ncbi:MAG: Zn-dependent hydrolase [Gemmatimonadetes bacterium]|nr:Zn-dependent hydrolase [Gemmatimonadota bacterium]
MDRRHFSRLLAGAAAGALLPRATWGGTAPRALAVNGPRLNGDLTALSAFGRNPQGGVTRLAYTEPDLQARRYVMDRMREAGLAIRIDRAGNIFGRRAGTDAAARPIVFGSHVDSVPEGGNYDGNVGVMGAVEVARTLNEGRVTTRHPLDVVVWQNEEGGTWGSNMATAARITADELALTARSGVTLRDGVTMLGGDPGRLEETRIRAGDVHGYLELHIEQGGTLHGAGIPIGVVEGIVALHQWEVTIEGFANHAGTTPMDQRRDAMLAAARFTELVNRTVRGEPGRQVGTVGRLQAYPGAPNVIPGKVVCTLELRDLDQRKVVRLYEAIRAEAARIASDTGTTFAYKPLTVHDPALCDPRVRALIGDSAAARGLATRSLPSGAGHDAQNMARVGPMGMIFIPSVDGISHSPREYSTPESITTGATVLLEAVLRMDAARFDTP